MGGCINPPPPPLARVKVEKEFLGRKFWYKTEQGDIL